MTHVRLRRDEARRIALAAQHLGRPKPVSPTMRDVQRVTSALGQFQIDSVNVLVRAHQMPLYARLGAYDPALLKRAAEQRPRRVFEYWGHAASMIDATLWGAMRTRMRRNREDPWRDVVKLEDDHPGFVAGVLDQVAMRGAVTAREVDDDPQRGKGHWWNWSDTKTALEWLWTIGEVAVAGRTNSFERLYDLPERVLPPSVLAVDHDEHQSGIELTRRAAGALGIASLACLNDYFRMNKPDTRRAVNHLVATGELIPATVDGWATDLYLWADAKRPRVLHAQALVAPFDSLVFERARLAALFDVDYRIEIYTPAAKRIYGYYVYPFVFGDRICARVDLKADRKAGRLLVQAAWIEDEAARYSEAVAHALADELGVLARWLGLATIAVAPRGTLASGLARVLG